MGFRVAQAVDDGSRAGDSPRTRGRFFRSKQVSAAHRAGNAFGAPVRVSPRREPHCRGAAVHHVAGRRMGRYAAAASRRRVAQLLYRRRASAGSHTRHTLQFVSGGPVDSVWGMNIAVWAPSAKSVELVTPERRVPLYPRTAGRAEAGYWQIEVDDSVLAHGYRYSIDGGEPIPDPRSKWQTDGVHGASHLVDIERLNAAQERAPRFVAKPLRDAVIYELHVGTFTPEGTYAAAQAKLPHLAQLGVTHVELMPLATFPGRRGWGYDGVDLYAPFPAYGAPPQLAVFVQACHARGIGVLLDVVYNHLGPDGNYLAQFGPYFTDRYKTNWGAAINYDGPHSDPVRRFITDNALMWLRDDGLDAHWADDFHHAVHRFFTSENNGYYADLHGLKDVAIALREGYVYQR